MTNISPLNAKLISNTSNHNAKSNKHDNIYKNLIAESAVIKPNKAKATLVRENPIQSVISSVKDFINDGKNFFIAAKTGKMDDNSLGRINDFGMLTGGLLIATFLASKAKTKTSAIMQYVGGGAFFASMALWPKIFINLPAKLIHGFNIDQKYISAQGEKKDFFLDNQFLPWDAFSQDELRQNAQKAGINYDSENGDEKIKRKMQKTALQNRTLWMATAGFATPLMTSLFGDIVEPKIKDAVIKNGFIKSQNALKNFDKTLADAKPITRHAKDIDKIIQEFQVGKINSSEMLNSLAKNLSLDLNEVLNDVDDIKTVKNLKFSTDINALKALRLEKSIIEEENLAELLKKAFLKSEQNGNIGSKLKSIFNQGVEVVSEQKGLSSETIDEIIKEFSQTDKKKTYSTLADIIKPYAKEQGIDSDKLARIMSKIQFEFDDTNFFASVKEYNTTVLAQIRGRLKEYLGTVLNPVIGSKDESVYTDLYRKAMKKALPETRKIFGIPIYDKKTIETLKAIKTSHKSLVEQGGSSELKYQASDAMAKVFAKIAGIKEDERYISELKKMFVEKDESISEFVKLAVDDANIAKITSVNVSKDKNSFEAMTKDAFKWISGNIKKFSELADINTDAIRSKALISANLERRIASEDFKQSLENAGLITKEFPLEEWIKKARYMVYQGTVASDACMLEFKNENLYKKLRDIVYDSSKFSAEKKIFSGLDNIIGGLRNLGTSTKDNSLATGMANLEKNVATDMLNNYSWKKIVIPAFIALVAITLLVQPLFGNIKKEFPEENEGGKK